MKKILLFLLLSVTFVFANVGKITAVKGEVYILRDAQKIVATSGSILILKDQLQTLKRSRALVLFNDNTSITVGKSSLLSVNEFVLDVKTPSRSKTNFGFGKGLFRTITGKIGKINPKGFKIKTKSASIGIRGTILDTSVQELPDGTEQVDVAFLYGHGVITHDENGIEIPVAKGQNARMQEDGQVIVRQGALRETPQMDEGFRELKEIQKQTPHEQSQPLDAPENKSPTIDTENLPKNNTPDHLNVVNGIENAKEDIDVIEEDIHEKSNTAPVFLESSIANGLEDEILFINTTASDNDGDTLTYSLATQPTNGSATIDTQTGLVTYTPNENYYGDDSIVISVTDNQGGTDTQTISIAISDVTDEGIYTSPINDVDDILDEVTKKSMCDTDAKPCDLYSEYIDYGYLLNSEGLEVDTYVNGTTTPTAIIDAYIQANHTASYTGNVAALVNGTPSTGSINLEMDFGAKNFTGDISVEIGNWKAAINSGAITANGFSSTDISAATSSSVSDITGSMSGKYYGANAEAVGGNFNLESTSSGTASGVFGGRK